MRSGCTKYNLSLPGIHVHPAEFGNLVEKNSPSCKELEDTAVLLRHESAHGDGRSLPESLFASSKLCIE